MDRLTERAVRVLPQIAAKLREERIADPTNGASCLWADELDAIATALAAKGNTTLPTYAAKADQEKA